MPQQHEAASSPAPSSFAGFLTALTTPGAPTRTSTASSWIDDGLEDDVATLSYERALRTHSRYRYADPSGQSLAEPPVPQTIPRQQSSSASTSLSALQATPQSTASSRGDADSALERSLKRASITIRMSNEECAQLHKRAAEAGLTVSAYLRSCTFEAESLRALVKDTLAQLKPDVSSNNQAASTSARRSSFKWLSRLLPRWRLAHHIVRA